MIDIEKELRSIKTNYKPDEDLRRRTRSLVTSGVREKKKAGTAFRKAAFVYSPIVAFVLVLALCISLLTAAPARAAGYYTIDINPSVSVAVDSGNTVISVSAEDEDAKALLDGINIKGMSFEDALKVIVQAAVEKDYLKDSGHVLVAYFGDGAGISQDDINSIVDEQIPTDKVRTLAISGSTDDYKNAKNSGKKAGIELLMNNAGNEGIEEKDPDTVINIMSDKLKEEKDKPVNNGNKDNGNNKGSGSGSKDKDKDKVKDKDKNKDKDKDKVKARNSGK